MESLTLEDFRCFTGRQEVPVRPLTLLVGENSTGKTSFLAAVRLAHDLISRDALDFNQDPFRLGSYDQIANFRGGSAGRAKSFGFGQQFLARGPYVPRPLRRRSRSPMQVEAHFRSDKSQPTISSFSVFLGEYELNLDLSGNNAHLVFSKDSQKLANAKLSERFRASAVRHIEEPWLVFRQAIREFREEGIEILSPADREQLDVFMDRGFFLRGNRAYAFAPIRTSPQRTYDPVTEVRDPEGSHIPMMLQRLLGNGDVPDFRDRLEEFGEASKLYSSLRVRKLGRTGSDPFQIEVKQPVGGQARNLMDVGYGVSQAIPIIADCVSAEPESTLLIQQPEVHLHPRAQAAMGSFFGQLAASGRNRLVVETHSDYLLDRVRIDVQEEKINCGDVMILYFEQDRHGVNIHPIELDGAGNLVNVPDGYRRFFLDEQRRFLGID